MSILQKDSPFRVVSVKAINDGDIIENEVYLCISGNDIFKARFQFGGGEFWWVNPETGKEMRVSGYSPDANRRVIEGLRERWK